MSGFFPPNAPMGAVRPAKLRDHWLRQGHAVRTIAIDCNGDAGNFGCDGIYYLPAAEPGALISALAARVRSAAPRRESATDPPERRPNGDGPAAFSLGDLYRQAVLIPDRYRLWIAPAVRLAMSWAQDWRPDIIFSSGPPHSGHAAASAIGRRLRVPWIAELRDLWLDNPYSPIHPLLRPLHAAYARKILGRASAFVAVTKGAQEHLQTRQSRPVTLSYNGFDPGDFVGLEQVEPLDRRNLTIVHAGMIYAGQRDPAPLFEAIASLGAMARVRCIFYHDESDAVAVLAHRFKISGRVEIRPSVPRAEILRIERRADILLECRRLDPSGDGVIPGKLFEYIGARRPILSIGSTTAEAAQIVRDNALGLASSDPGAIRAALENWLTAKKMHARLPDLSADTLRRFQRDAQFRKIDVLMEQTQSAG